MSARGPLAAAVALGLVFASGAMAQTPPAPAQPTAPTPQQQEPLAPGQVFPHLPGPPRIGDKLARTRWRAVSVQGKPVIKGSEPTLEILDDGYARGSTGCNRYVGPFATRADHGVFGPASKTRVDCAPALGRQESFFLDTLEHTERLELKDKEQTLLVYSSLSAQPSHFVRLP